MRVTTSYQDIKTAIGFSYFDSAREIPMSLGNPQDKHAPCNNVDYIIAINGRYQYYDADHNYSEDDSEEVLTRLYGDKVIHDRYYGFQPDKRQRYLDIAGQLKCDYLIVWDAGDLLHPNLKYQDWQKFYRQLLYENKYYGKDRVFYLKFWIPSMKIWRDGGNTVKKNAWHSYARVHKNPGTMRYAYHYHWKWSSKKTTDEQISKWINDNPDAVIDCPYFFQPVRNLDGIRLTTNTFNRNGQQLTLRDKWAKANNTAENLRRYIIEMTQKNIKTYLPDLSKPHHFEWDGKLVFDNELLQNPVSH